MHLSMNIIKQEEQESILLKCIFASLLISDEIDAPYNLFASWQNGNDFSHEKSDQIKLVEGEEEEGEDGKLALLQESYVFMAASELRIEELLQRACDLSSILEIRCYRRLMNEKYEWSLYVCPFSETDLCFDIDSAPRQLKACIIECIHRNMFISRKEDSIGNAFFFTSFVKDEEASELFQETQIVMLLILRVLIVAASFSDDPSKQRARICNAFNNTLKKKKIQGQIFNDLRVLMTEKDKQNPFNRGKLDDLFRSYCNKWIVEP